MSPFEVGFVLFSIFGVLIILRIPVAFALGLACVPVFFLDERMTPMLLAYEMFKAYNSFVILAVPFFLLAANLMNAAGITDQLIKFCQTIVGRFPGGLGHVNVLVSMIFAGISGSSNADAAGIGSILIPAMKKQGYTTSFTVAITACSAVMGVIIPPSILMVVWGGLMSISVGALFLAGVVPGVLIGLSQMIFVYVYARIYHFPVDSNYGFLDFIKAFGTSFLALMTPAIIVGGIVGGVFTPTEASAVAVVYSLGIGTLVFGSLSWRGAVKVFYDSARFAAIALFCVGTASAFGWILAYFQIPAAIVSTMASWGTTPTGVALITCLSFLVVGCFIDAIPAIIIVGTVLSPLATAAGIHPVHFAIIGVVSIAFGLVTPPYGLCLLISCAIGNIKLVAALKDVLIILFPMICVLMFIVFFPDVIMFLPRAFMGQYM